MTESCEFTPTVPSGGNLVNVSIDVAFPELDAGATPGANAITAIQIGTNGSFQVWAKAGNGEEGAGNGWRDVAAEGVTPEVDTEYSFSLTLDYRVKLFSVALVEGFTVLQLAAADGTTEFPFAASNSTSVSSVGFVGEGTLAAIRGSYFTVEGFEKDEAVAVKDSASVILSAAQAAWLNGLGEKATVAGKAATVSAEDFGKAYLLNLDITQDGFGYTFEVTGIEVARRRWRRSRAIRSSRLALRRSAMTTSRMARLQRPSFRLNQMLARSFSRQESKKGRKMKNLIFAVVLAAGVAAGFAVGRMCAGGVCESNAPSAAVTPSDGALEKANARIAELERRLAESKKEAQRMRGLAARAENAVSNAMDSIKNGADAVAPFSVGTNVDIVTELKNQLPEEAFVAATNAFERMKAANAERAKGRREYLASLDVSSFSAKERENHKKFMEMFDRREKAKAKMKGGIPDQSTIQELMEAEIQMAPIAKTERVALARELARELGCSGEDVDTVQEAIGNIFDCTSGGGLDGMMDAAEGMPGVEIGTDVQVLTL